MKKLVLFTIFLTTLAACGRPDSIPNIHEAPESACLVKNFCTTDNFDPKAGNIWCVANRVEPMLSPDVDYQGRPCIITYEDWQYTDGCDYYHPTFTCHGNWGSGPATPCCPSFQGPGPKAVP